MVVRNEISMKERVQRSLIGGLPPN